ncbi:MAG: threonylcarbamoyl-AMP synthase [Anaerolineales bacterium]|nr:threonylcarbamoyl-AMP synthase [Anaerolineales bacterium]
MNPNSQSSLITVDPFHPEPAAIQRAVECLIRGGLVAFPTETVYGLGAHAFDPSAVRRVFEVKGRPPADPLIVHLASIADTQTVAAHIPPAAEALGLRFWPGPLTLLLPRRSSLPPEVSAGLDTVAVRVPSHPVAQALLQAAGLPVAAPSANLFGHASPTLARHVIDDLGGRVDLILDAGPTEWGVESTILDPLQSPPVLLRPGGISIAELESVLGPIRIAAPAERISASPGRQPRHYAPNARLILCPGETPADIAESVRSTARRERKENRRIGLLAASEVASRIEPSETPVILRDLGSIGDLRGISRRLFACLRELEAEGVDIILAHRLPGEGVGAAVNDRLTRAAAEEDGSV